MISESSKTQLKSVDPDRYRSALLAAKADRDRLLCLYAFHHELAKVPELVSEPMIGQIRYQWWRDTIAEIYSDGTVRAHEVTTPLNTVVQQADLPRFWMDQLIDGRERDLDPTPFPTIEAAIGYCRATSGNLAQLAVKTLGQEPNDHVIKAGEAWGLTGLARAWSYYHGSILADLRFEDIIEAADEAYKSASQGLKLMADDALPAYAYCALIPKYLTRMTRTNFDPLTMQVSFQPFFKQVRLLGAVLRGRV